MTNNNLIFGKDTTDRIVSVDNDQNGNFYVFRQLEDGTIEQTKHQSLFWFISNERISSKQTELKGDQYYKYLAQFSTQKERDDVIKLLKQEGVDYYRVFDQKEQSLLYRGMTYFKELLPTQIGALSFDLETSGLLHDENSRILIISNTFRNYKGELTRKMFALDDYEGDERSMIQDWVRWVRKIDPSIIMGHNIYGFDIPYLRFRAQELNLRLALGRNGSSIHFDKWESSKRKDGSQDIEYINCHIFGREIVDTMFLSITYDVGRAFPSYALKTIINHLGMEKKDRTFVEAGKINYYYENDPQMWAKAKQYAEEDSDDALKLFDLMIPAYFYFTRSVSKSFQQMINSATGSQINNIMVRSYLQEGHSIAKADLAERFQGAISFGIPGLYKNGFKVDVSSLYPSIMRQYRVYSKEKDPLCNFINMVEYFTLERLKNKALAKETGMQYYKDLEQSQKVAINSAYGFLGATGLNYNYPAGAAFVTEKGREVLSIATKFSTGKPIEYWSGLSGGSDETEGDGDSQAA
jgi:DNA polymerase I